MKSLLKDQMFLATIAVIFLAIVLLLIVKEARSEEPVIIPVGRTAYTIEPYWELKPIVEAHINQPKKADYCPAQDGDYQCPMPDDADDTPR